MTTKDSLNEIREKISSFVPIMDGLSRARNPFELRYFVIGKHDDRVQQYKQAVIEMEAKYKALLEGEHGRRVRDIERRRIKRKMETLHDDLDLEEQELALLRLDREDREGLIGMTGAFKEVLDFIHIIETEFADLVEKTEEELLRYEAGYWKKRFAKQCHIDLAAYGRLGEGNRSAIEQMPKDIQEEILIEAAMRTEEVKRFEDAAAKKALLRIDESYPHQTAFIAPPDYLPLKLSKDAPEGYPEDHIVHIDRAEIMLASLHRPGDKIWLASSFFVPGGKNYMRRVVTCPEPQMIGEWRNRIVKDALSCGCTHLFFVDDDLVVPEDALQKLFAHDLDIVGGWYTKKEPIPGSATLISSEDGKSCMPVPHTATGLVEVDWVLTAGLTLIKTDVFRKIPYPWYLTTEYGTEDTYFSARCREVGIKQWLDTSIKAEHVDKVSGDAYGFNGIEWGKYFEKINAMRT